MRLYALLLAALLCLPPLDVAAQDNAGARVVTVVFQTSPTGAEVYQSMGFDRQHLGQSGEAVRLTLRPRQDVVPLIMHLDGYQDEIVDMPVAVLSGPQPIRYPPQPVALKALSPFSPLLWMWHRHPYASGTLLLAVLGFLGWLVPRQREVMARAARMRALNIDKDRGDPNLGKAFKGWVLTRHLGSGGCATVYEAVPQDTLDAAQAVAVKIMRREVVDDEFRRRFSREVRICLALQHPNIVRVLKWYDDDIPMIVMELVRGETLRSRMRDGGMRLSEALLLLRQVVAGLCYAHEQKIVHNDLKPANILVTDNNRVRLMDFGIATGQTFTRLTATGLTFGTPGYMAPEQYDGIRDDARSDQYAFGVIAYEMLSGRRPFNETDPMACLAAQLAQTPPLVSELNSGVPRTAAEAIARMLSPHVKDRFATLQEAWQALESAALTSQ